MSKTLTNTNSRVSEFEHDDQLLKLDQYVKVMLAGDSDLCGILISGYPGVGKTHLVESYLKKYQGEHPALIARHRQQHAEIPYFGLKNAISDFITKKYNQLTRKEFQKFTQQIKDYFGDSFPLFLEYIPDVSSIMQKDYEISQTYAPKVKNQLFHLFKTFFLFLNQYSKHPIFFFTDDLQWIDTSGTRLLKNLLLELPSDKLIWVASCRESSDNAYLYFQLVEQLGFNKKRVETIHLQRFNKNQVKRLVESSLNGRIHVDLAEICYVLCEGNPTYLQVLLDSIKNTDYIWKLDDIWQCDAEAISKYYKGKGKEQILFKRLGDISEQTRSMLYMMACMGGYNHRVLIDSFNGNEGALHLSLKEAINSELIKEEHGSYLFAKRHIGELIYENLPHLQRQEVHYAIAKLLYNSGVDSLNTTQMVLMTTQFNKSLSLVRKYSEQEICAELNYLAGQYSRKDNALHQAQYFYKMCADLLKECPRPQVSEKVYLVYMERAHVDYILGDHDLAEIHLDHLLENFEDIYKRAHVYELKITINNHCGRYRKAVHILQECLRELNIDLPLDEPLLLNEISKLQSLQQNPEAVKDKNSWSENYIKNQHLVLKLLYVGGMSLHHTSDVLMKWAALQIINRSKMDSAWGEKAIGYVSYGRMLIIDGNIDRGYTYGRKGLEINNTLEDITLRCRVYGVYAFYIQPWKKAFSESYPLLDKGIEAGEKAGDLIGSYILKTHKLNIHILSGLPLYAIDSVDFDDTPPEMELTYYITLYQKNFIKFLLGKSAIFSLSEHKPSRLAAKFTIQEEKFYRNHVRARYYLLFGYYELAEKSAHEADINRKLQEGSPLHPANLMVWFLAITQNWFNYSNDQKLALKIHTDYILGLFDLWSTYSPANYASSYWLLKAEHQRITGNTDEVGNCYLRAIEMAGNNLYNKALSSEFFAKYLLSRAEKKESLMFLIQSIELYEQWGGITKVKQLCQQYHAMIPKKYHPSADVNIEMIQHEFSGDLEVESLVNKLMVLLLRISGSTRVAIKSAMNDGDESQLGDFSLLDQSNTDFYKEIPLALILLAHRSQNRIVVNNLKSDNNLGDLGSFYDRGVRSMLIFPVTIHNDLSLVIYLENSFAEDWYTAEIIRWVRITSNQASVILENARIHELTVKLNNDLRQQMNEKERLATLIEKQKDIHLNALVKAQDDERKRIASDLHDSLGSLLSSIKLRFNGMQPDAFKESPQKATQFNTALGLIDDAVDELRRIAHNMLPTALTKFGLKAALNTFVENVQLSEHLDIDLQVLGLEKRLSEETEVSVYRICQELVQNVLKHAQANFMRLQIIDHGDMINLIVEDNGVGIDRDKVVHGFGFHTIESKVKFLKGTFNIESTPGSGTMILINIPV